MEDARQVLTALLAEVEDHVARLRPAAEIFREDGSPQTSRRASLLAEGASNVALLIRGKLASL